MASSCSAFQVSCCLHKPSISYFDRFKPTLSSAFQPFLRELQQHSIRIDVSKTIKNVSVNLLDAFVDHMFEFIDHPSLPSQSNFTPVDQLREAVLVTSIEGEIPEDFPEGVYIRNGSNPLFGGLKSTKSIFGRSSHTWIEGEGMLHALYFNKGTNGSWNVVYNNRHVETETFKLEKLRNKPSFLPAIQGDSTAVLSAYLLNFLRFGKVNKYLSNTNIFEHAGRFYSISENHIPQEIDIFTLKTYDNWDVNGTWNRPFTSHPKKAPGTGELIIMGIDAAKPFAEVGVVSADGNKLVHRMDLKLNRCTLCHEIGVTWSYNIFLDFPLSINIDRLVQGGQLINYEREGYARIGVMPRYGDADSIQWFNVKPNCTFHIINCFEDGDEVVVLGCRALESVIPGPTLDLNKSGRYSGKSRHVDFASKDVFSSPYEWRLNMQTGEVKERNLCGTQFYMDFPMINGGYTGIKSKYGYAQIVDTTASSESGMPKYRGLAKLYFEEEAIDFPSRETQSEKPRKLEYHELEENVFCTGAAFVSKGKGFKEDDGWIISFVHYEHTNISQAYIIDTRRFSSEAVVKITLPCRVPYGFHGAFMPMPLSHLKHRDFL